MSHATLAQGARASIDCVEKDSETFGRAQSLRAWKGTTRWLQGDNTDVMRSLAKGGVKFDVIDLDPFVSCREQVDLLWPLLADAAGLFVTFGGEYRRSFIQTNRIAIGRRYGFLDTTMANSDYLEVVPSYFLGWLASEAAKNGFIFELKRAVRYPNNCRYWLRAMRASSDECAAWLGSHTRPGSGGVRWEALLIPRFAELRKETERKERARANEGRAQPPRAKKPLARKKDRAGAQATFGFHHG